MRVNLTEAMFARHEAELLIAGDIAVTTFRYASGVAALRIRSPRVELIVLPFKGQQIWRAVFDGVDVTMKSRGYSFGGFFFLTSTPAAAWLMMLMVASAVSHTFPCGLRSWNCLGPSLMMQSRHLYIMSSFACMS